MTSSGDGNFAPLSGDNFAPLSGDRNAIFEGTE